VQTVYIQEHKIVVSVHIITMSLYSENLFYVLPSRWKVYDIGDPYVEYTIKVKLEQLDYVQSRDEQGNNIEPKNIWKTIGEVYLGPHSHSDSIMGQGEGKSSTPQV